MTQLTRLKKLLRRGATSMEICRAVETVSPHSRLSDLKREGWTITRKPIEGKNYGKYYGIAPKMRS